jgi:hypothetical protein
MIILRVINLLIRKTKIIDEIYKTWGYGLLTQLLRNVFIMYTTEDDARCKGDDLDVN